ncbi:MAG: ribosome small subunit-dependent GTPase A, partial [Bacteroidetes bacterium HGW-Bacteroidetes-22]
AILVVTPSQPRTSTGFIDRFLISANAFDIPVVIIFNKSDLYTLDDNNTIATLTTLYQKIGHSCLVTSALTGYGINELRSIMQDKVSMIAGHSGAGKSALINAVEPGLRIRTGDISDANQKGRHTTTFAEMHPLSAGGFITDTPGIKEFGINSIEKREIAGYFPEFFALLHKCKYFNCSHIHEPGCAVKSALETGEISPSRYRSYLSIMNGEEFEEEHD